MTQTFQHDYASLKSRIDGALAEIVVGRDWPNSLAEAVNYSLLANGKRLRPVMTLMASRACGGRFEEAVPAACAVEMIHTYSLIHDDLPAMDNDDLRRGRPTSHVIFGEALAILAGDALLTLAFETLASADLSAEVRADCTVVLAQAAGGAGMAGGQVLDLEAERGCLAPEFPNSPAGACAEPDATAVKPSERAASSQSREARSEDPSSTPDLIHVEHLMQIHKMKTGALITAALELGAAASTAEAGQRAGLIRFGQCIGLAFQITDDLLDVTGSDASLGKQPGRDQELGKLTYPSLIGVEASRIKAAELIDEAHGALDIFTDRAEPLRQLARFIVERDH
ncbi:MAG: polyprenyl synthetase family protein [Planctomycetaceae bacterium]